MRYALPDGDRNAGGILQAWAYEACRLFRDKLASEDDVSKFDNLLRASLQADWNSNAADAVNRAFFVTPADSSFSPGSPMPKFGRPLGHLGGNSIALKNCPKIPRKCARKPIATCICIRFTFLMEFH